jgi:hypothetical protein
LRVYRSEYDSIERMMDEVADHFGFYDPLFQTAFQQAILGQPHLKFGAIETIINEAFPAASLQSTLFASTRRLPTPVFYLEATVAQKEDVERRLATLSLFDDDLTPGELRTVRGIPNKAAQQDGWTIPTNMRVPDDSVIHGLFDADPIADCNSQECWSQCGSQGRSLERRAVVVKVRKFPGRVLAIAQPVEAGGKSYSKTNYHQFFH